MGKLATYQVRFEEDSDDDWQDVQVVAPFDQAADAAEEFAESEDVDNDFENGQSVLVRRPGSDEAEIFEVESYVVKTYNALKVD